MLDGLDAVAWGSLEHAHGSASDVPEHLRAIAGGGEAGRAALEALHGTIWNQGSVFPASEAAVPFLVELARRGPAALRPGLLGLLMRLGTGRSVGESFAAYDASLLEKPGVRERIEREQVYVHATHAAVDAGIAELAPLIDDADASVRVALAMLFRAMPSAATSSVPALARRAGTELESIPLCVIVLALGELALPSVRDAVLATLTRIEGAEDPLVRFSIACAIVAVEGPAATEETVHVLRDAIRNPDEIESAWSLLPLDTPLITFAAEVLGKLGKHQVAAIAPELGAALDRVDTFSSMLLVARMLWSVIDAPLANRPRESLSPAALDVLRAVCAAEKPWLFTSNIRDVLADWGLPVDREALQKFAGPG